MTLQNNFGTNISYKLKQFRLQSNKTLEEVSNNIHVHKTYLSKVETGRTKVSKRILIRLISEYNIPKKDAIELFTSLGYNTSGLIMDSKEVNNEMPANIVLPSEVKRQEINVNVPQNNPVLYTDSAFVTASPYGVVLDFAQTLGPTPTQQVVARVGMSREHALALLNVLRDKLVGKVSEVKN